MAGFQWDSLELVPSGPSREIEETSKLQHPSSREVPIFKHPMRVVLSASWSTAIMVDPRRVGWKFSGDWRLEFEVYFDPGLGELEFPPCELM
jgi:hypothetical protein